MYKAMVMSAGVGSRLDPLTKSVPKPLVPICNKPVMDILLENLSAIGVVDVVANTFYLSEQIIARYVKNHLGINFNYITRVDEYPFLKMKEDSNAYNISNFYLLRIHMQL